MTEAHQEHDSPHEGPIKTPKQVIVAVFFSFLVPIVVIVLLASYVSTAPLPGAGSDGLGKEAVAARIRPVGRVEIKDASDIAAMKTDLPHHTVHKKCRAGHIARVFEHQNEEEEDPEDKGGNVADSSDEDDEFEPGALILIRQSYLKSAAPRERIRSRARPAAKKAKTAPAAAAATIPKKIAVRGTYFGDGDKWKVERWKTRYVHTHAQQTSIHDYKRHGTTIQISSRSRKLTCACVLSLGEYGQYWCCC